MRHVRKQFASLVAIDSKALEVRLKIEGEEKETLWPILPDAQVKIHGWWGRLDQLRPSDRLWIWFAVDRDKKPKSVLMIADEMSEQDIHGKPPTIKTVEDEKMALHFPGAKQDKFPERELTVDEAYSGPRDVGEKVFLQTSGEKIREGVSPEAFEKLRHQQREWLRARWREDGLPGAVSVLHPLGGEMEVLLDHEAIRWGRYLKNGDAVTLQTERPIKAVIKSVQPWRERTRLRLVTNSGLDQQDLTVGERIAITVPEPPADVQQSNLPPDIGRLEEKQERIDWFLSTIYCSCGIAGDRCTGMFYVQSSCNVNACGMPNEISRVIGEKIESGLSDLEIFNKLKEERGRDFWQPHLLR